MAQEEQEKRLISLFQENKLESVNRVYSEKKVIKKKND